MGIVHVAALNELPDLLVSLEELVEAAEYSASHHDNALFETGGNQLLPICRLATAATDHPCQFLASTDRKLQSGGVREDYLVLYGQRCCLSGKLVGLYWRR